MAFPEKFLRIRWSKYSLLSLLVIVTILGMLIAVLFWYERKVQRIDKEMIRHEIVAESKVRSIAKHCFYYSQL
jgi:hypothetical protein